MKSLQRQNVELEKKLARVETQRSAQNKNNKKNHRQTTSACDERLSIQPCYVKELETQ